MVGVNLLWMCAAVLAFAAGMMLALWRAPDTVTLPAARSLPADGPALDAPYVAPPLLAAAGSGGQEAVD